MHKHSKSECPGCPDSAKYLEKRLIEKVKLGGFLWVKVLNILVKRLNIFVNILNIFGQRSPSLAKTPLPMCKLTAFSRSNIYNLFDLLRLNLSKLFHMTILF